MKKTPNFYDVKDTLCSDFRAGQMLSISTVMALAGLGRTKVYSEIRDGRLICVKVGSRTLTTSENYLAWQKALPTRTAQTKITRGNPC